jgi:hypothetical protein
MRQTTVEENADVVIISEQYRDYTEENGWFADSGGRAAVYVDRNIAVDEIGPKELGFRWVVIRGIRVYSCYWSPNLPFSQFEDFATRLEISVRGSTLPVIVAGDFNAKSQEWGSPMEDRKGRLLADWAASLGLLVCNRGNKPTFSRGSSESFIDCTFASGQLFSRIFNWEVSEKESLSLHHYISFKMTIIGRTNVGTASQVTRGWSTRSLDLIKLKARLKNDAQSTMVSSCSAEEHAAALTTWLTDISDMCMRRRSSIIGRKPVPWWSSTIADMRKAVFKSRRAYQKKRKKHGEVNCVAEHNAYKAAKKELVVEISNAKARCWSELLDTVDRDIWGQPYKIVMKRLGRKRPIPGLELPGRLERIVSALFPQPRHLLMRAADESAPDRGYVPCTIGELISAAKTLPNGKAPGPDGIPNEVVRAAALSVPSRFVHALNKCFDEGLYPDRWKVANLVLLPKPGRPLDDPSAYRPLCMLDGCGKLFEKIIVRRLRTHLDSGHALSSRQFGFRPNKSTIDALSCLRGIVERANGRGYARNLYVGVLTLDVKNAFNSAPWPKIRDALRRKEVPLYLQKIIGAYLSNRSINVTLPSGEVRNHEVRCGVPQGSVLGPDLWNIFYDELLEIGLPVDVELIAYADDVAIVATARVPHILEERLEEAMRSVTNWMDENGLELAVGKTEAIVLTNRNVRNSMVVSFDGHRFESQPSVRYLGVQVDSRLRFAKHAELAAARAADACRQLSQLLPNSRGPRQKTRKILASVVTSRLLYGAPIWFPTMTSRARKRMSSVLRRTMLRVACCYRTVSYEAAAVVSGIPPLNLLAEERKNVYNGMDAEVAHERLLEDWQQVWVVAVNGRWTHRLIGDVGKWHKRKHGEMTFHMTQVLTGHGCFNAYLKRFGKSETDACAQCGASPDDAEHAVFRCDAWQRWRIEACVYLGVENLTPENVINVMLESSAAWARVERLFSRIMGIRETEDRARQQLRRLN